MTVGFSSFPIGILIIELFNVSYRTEKTESTISVENPRCIVIICTLL